jgi:arabinogalactan endo-1,4-beta-galactosidase
MRPLSFVLALILLLSACSKSAGTDPIVDPVPPLPPVPSPNANFIRGLDLSFSPEILTAGTKFYVSGQQADLLQICKDKGINTIRLRLWHSPSSSNSSLKEVVDFSKTLAAKGFGIWLDIHYSDSWADPGNQNKPAAWKNATGTVLKDSVYQYTTRVMSAFKTAGVSLKIVQIGNETNAGFLWNDARVGGTYDNNWAYYALLVKEGLRAVKEADANTKTMLHFAGIDGAEWYYNNLALQTVSYDYIGLSFYPIWHGKSLDALGTGLTNLISKFQKPIVIAETSYPFTLSWNDYTNNVWGLANQLIPEYSASPEGQQAYTKALMDQLKKLPQQQGMGLCWWAPEWVAFKGPTATNGSSMENLTLFDFSNNALPALTSLGSY